MSRGESGRIVIEVDPGLKRQLHALLALNGSTLKRWFIKNASDYINDQQQSHPVKTYGSSRSGHEALLAAEKPPKYKTKKIPKT
jgi:hypothetical protein